MIHIGMPDRGPQWVRAYGARGRKSRFDKSIVVFNNVKCDIAKIVKSILKSNDHYSLH